MAIKAIAFDIDGTLYPNWKMQLNSIPFFLLHPRLIYKFGEIRKEIRKIDNIKNFEKTQASLLADALSINAEKAHFLINTYFYTKWEKTFSRIKPFENIKEVIKSIKALNLKTAVMSDFPIGEKLNFFGLENLWDVEVSSEESGYLKPDKRPFLYLSDKLELKPDEIIYVGNSYSYDIIGAKKVGMTAGHLASSEKDGSIADFTFSSYMDFVERIKKFL